MAKKKLRGSVKRVIKPVILHDEENSAIVDALSVLRTLENEESRFDEEERKRLAADALRKIDPLSAID
jgi:hypothetical protein